MILLKKKKKKTAREIHAFRIADFSQSVGFKKNKHVHHKYRRVVLDARAVETCILIVNYDLIFEVQKKFIGLGFFFFGAQTCTKALCILYEPQ